MLFQRQGLFPQGLEQLERGNGLGSKQRDWRYPSAEWVRKARILADLDRRLPAIIAGTDRPAGREEIAALPDVCYKKQRFAASARFWQEAFQAQAALSEDVAAGNRYNAACSAALAGSGKGEDNPPLDEPTRARWRKQALDWLKADLAAWAKLLQGGPAQARQTISETLQHWKADPDLAGLRDPEALKRRPEEEQNACRALWAEVDALLAKARGAGKP